MKLYGDTCSELGKTNDMTRPMFYARLAYISLEGNVHREAEISVEMNEGGSEDEEEQDERELSLSLSAWQVRPFFEGRGT